MDRRSLWWVHTQSPEDRALPGPFIPAVGYPTSACDLYRVVGIARTGHEGWNSCYSDVATCIGLARIIEGQVRSWDDIEAAENSLQVLLWHDRVDIVVPGFKCVSGALRHYIRCESKRSELAMEVFKPCQPYDVILAAEEVNSEDRCIKESNYAESAIVGSTLDDAESKYLEVTPIMAAAISTIPLEMRVPAYFSDPIVESFYGKRGFSGRFYDTIRRAWDDAGMIVPDIEYDLRLPPLLSIVLDRAESRDSIPDVISDLRDETGPVREEMQQFSEIVKSSVGEAEIEVKCQDIQESFDSIFKASRQTKETAILPLLRLCKAIKSPLETLISLLNPNFQMSDPHILANRTVTGKMFAKLLRTDSMYSLLSNFFTKAEISALEQKKPS